LSRARRTNLGNSECFNCWAETFSANRGGANGNIAMEIVAHAPAGGYTLGLALTGQLAINQSLYRSIPYDPIKDFTPITLLGSAPYFLALNRAVPATTLEEFIKRLISESPQAGSAA